MNVSTMKVFAGRCLPLLALGVTFAVLPGPTAWAQGMGMGGMGGGMGRSNSGSGSQPKAAPAAPDAIPGAVARAPAAPATKGNGDLAPTDALFDAINRGDIAAARDALNRGADLNGVNVLGMTPMELSV
ncbi:MAG TPA: ankyrin repeat domain-containing protein, partial [Rhodopila sp.]|nr:ankyrin repeat domain-containing protein [Rhodopila sp.]